MSNKRMFFTFFCFALLIYAQNESYKYLQPNVTTVDMATIEGLLRASLLLPVIISFGIVDFYLRKKEKQVKVASVVN